MTEAAYYSYYLYKKTKAMSEAQNIFPQMQPRKVYLAIPYTFNPALSHQIANKVTADLMNKGYVVFSPISHSHHVSDHLPDLVRTDSDWWMTQDLPFVEWADEIHVVCIGENGTELIDKSKGVQMELLHANRHNKPIKVIEYYA